jgi:leucyl-tRNA synthetase
MSTAPRAHKSEPDIPPHRYTAAMAGEIEQRWQREWLERGVFRAPNPGEPGFDGARPKFYCLDMFPYPSGAGLHVGHPEGYTATDIVSRYKRMTGHNVLHPMGWDAFGLPAEQYAIQTNIHPATTTAKAIDTFRRQLQRFGFCYDWSREVATIDPAYYKWTQWIFLQLYNSWYDPEAEGRNGGRGRARPIAELIGELESGSARVGIGGDIVRAGVNKPLSVIGGGDPVGTRRWHELSAEEQRRFIDNQRLAYVDEVMVNWCPKLGTVLANEEVIDGKSERGGYPVFRRPLRQWMLRITAYADRLLEDLRLVDWPESTRTQQAEWIGRSEGAEIDFPIAGSDSESIRVFTTRPDTIFGATYMVLAPEHPVVDRLLKHPRPSTNVSALRDYVTAARNRAEVDRLADAGAHNKEKTGVPTGLAAINPATGERIPVWVADYVLMGYGHGAIMAVPAHDERDFAFAKTFGLPIRDVVYGRTDAAMAYFARHATEEERTTERWRTVLADFMGLVTTIEAKPEIFGQVLDAVRGRREALPPEQSGMPEMRGSISGEWHATFEGMGLGTFADLQRLYGAADRWALQGRAMTAPGFAVNSSNKEVSLDGLPTEQAKERIIEWLERSGNGRRKVNYRLRDWLFSRQRYWGEPFPIVWDEQGNHYPVAESALPVTLPPMQDFVPPESPDPAPLLAKAQDWVNTTAGEAGVSPELLRPETPVRRETNTMPNWAGSCWYYLRFCDPRNNAAFCSAEAERYWMGDRGVDLYIGGAEHAVLHLLYARFWHKVLYDLGHVSTPEPFAKLFHQGLITAYSYQRPDKTLVPNDQVEEVSEGVFVEKGTGVKLTPVVAKMSKTLKNVVNPDDVIAEYGADTFRLYEMYMGPLEASKPWNTRDIVGPFRFLQRLWRNLVDENTGRCTVTDAQPDDATLRLLHKTIKAVRQGIEGLSLNTAIAKLIELNNHLTTVAARDGGVPRMVATPLVLMVSPFAPHIAEELWRKLGREGYCIDHGFPVHDDRYTADESIEMPISIQGKVRHKIMVPATADAAAIEAAALAEPRVQELLGGKPVKKVIVVPGRMVNIVI